MALMSDTWIKEMSLKFEMINPFSEEQISKEVISYGLSSYGYDIRLSNEFKLLKSHKVIDPKKIEDDYFEHLHEDRFIIPPFSFVLGRSIEYFKIPRNILTLGFGKSTYARCGIMVNITPFEPEWEGFATLAISNLTPNPVKIYPNEGIAQIVFIEAKSICKISYKDRKGKYQSASSIAIAKI
jgi:dCTP deaminase